MTFDFDTYLSPFTWRYGGPEMRQIWSETHKRLLWRRLWVALAEVEARFGVLKPEQAADLQAHIDQVDVGRALEIEAEIQHDLMAELRTFAEQSPVGGGGLHLGATSMDIEDNADVLRVRSSLDLILARLKSLLAHLAAKIEAWAEQPLMAFTHLQPAEPSTLGYRLAQYAQDLLIDWQALTALRAGLRGKGFRGAVGTGASFAELIGEEQLVEFDRRLSEKLELEFFPVCTQVYPRKQDYQVIAALAGCAGSLYKLAFDLRILQNPLIGELSEPFGKKQVGSSAMPFKRNPIQAEKIDSLARSLAQMPRLAWDNAAHSLLERTLDDSANRRTLLPEAFLTMDELLLVAGKILAGLQVNEAALNRNLAIFGPFAAIERVLMAAAKAGGDRQRLHERLRTHAMAAWEAVQVGKANPLAEHLRQDPELIKFLNDSELAALMDVSHHLGDAPLRARKLVQAIRIQIA